MRSARRDRTQGRQETVGRVVKLEKESIGHSLLRVLQQLGVRRDKRWLMPIMFCYRAIAVSRQIIMEGSGVVPFDVEGCKAKSDSTGMAKKVLVKLVMFSSLGGEKVLDFIMDLDGCWVNNKQ